MTFNPALHPRGHHTNLGRFSQKPHSDPEATLASPRGTETETLRGRRWLELNGGHLPDRGVTLLGERLVAEPDADPLRKQQMFEEVYEQVNGHTPGRFRAYARAAELLEASGEPEHLPTVAELLQPRVDGSTPAAPVVTSYPPARSEPGAVNSADPRVQAGGVFDVVEVDGVVFQRRQDGVYPGTPYAMRFQASRPIGDDEVQHLAGLVGYAARAEIRGEPLSGPERDSPYSFVVGCDTTKSRSDDLGVALERFEAALPDLIENGSPIRTTDRAGAGTKGTRLIEPVSFLGDFEVYYDDVTGS